MEQLLKLNNAYEKLVFWRKNPMGNADNTLLKSINLKEIHVMLALLFQKPSQTSNCKDHLSAFETYCRFGKRRSQVIST